MNRYLASFLGFKWSSDGMKGSCGSVHVEVTSRGDGKDVVVARVEAPIKSGNKWQKAQHDIGAWVVEPDQSVQGIYRAIRKHAGQFMPPPPPSKKQVRKQPKVPPDEVVRALSTDPRLLWEVTNKLSKFKILGPWQRLGAANKWTRCKVSSHPGPLTIVRTGRQNRGRDHRYDIKGSVQNVRREGSFPSTTTWEDAREMADKALEEGGWLLL